MYGDFIGTVCRYRWTVPMKSLRRSVRTKIPAQMKVRERNGIEQAATPGNKHAQQRRQRKGNEREAAHSGFGARAAQRVRASRLKQQHMRQHRDVEGRAGPEEPRRPSLLPK